MKIYPPATYRSLATTDGHVDEFGSYFSALKFRWVKVERLQEYDESDFEGYRLFQRGEYAEAQRLVQEMVRSQDVYEHAAAIGLKMIRVRICELPLSSYLRNYEIAAYEADVDCGEDIRFVAVDEIEDLLQRTGVEDFVLFDDQRAVALLYDFKSCSLKEARLVEDPALLAEYVKVADELIGRSLPMRESPIYRKAKESQ